MCCSLRCSCAASMCRYLHEPLANQSLPLFLGQQDHIGSCQRQCARTCGGYSRIRTRTTYGKAGGSLTLNPRPQT